MDTRAAAGKGPRDPALWIAVIGNTILAIPALGSFGLLLMFLSMGGAWWDGADLLGTWLMLVATFAFLAPIVLGFYLLFGYWRAVRRGRPAARERLFWLTSAAYNVVAAVGWAALGVAERPGFPQLLGLAWAVFMAWLSIREAAQASGRGDPLPR